MPPAPMPLIAMPMPFLASPIGDTMFVDVVLTEVLVLDDFDAAAAALEEAPADALLAPEAPLAAEAAALPPAAAAALPEPLLELLVVTEVVEAAAPSVPEPASPSSTEVVVVSVESLGNELVSRSRVAAPNNESGFVIALSNHAPEDAPPEAIKFSAVPATLAIGRATVSSICDLMPSENTLLALDKLVAMF